MVLRGPAEVPKAIGGGYAEVIHVARNALWKVRPREAPIPMTCSGGESSRKGLDLASSRRARSVHYSALRRVGMQVAKYLQLVNPAANTSLELRSAFQGVWLDAHSSSTIRSAHLSSRGPQVLKRLNRRLSLSCFVSPLMWEALWMPRIA